MAQMVFGALMIVFGVACIFSAYHWSSHVGFGVWVGLWVSFILSYDRACVGRQLMMYMQDCLSIVIIKPARSF